jgi:DNA-binding winged helix-turn-helix (wHTH) protein
MDRVSPASAGGTQTGYRFGGFRLEADGTLLRDGTPFSLPARELAALRLLLARQGQVVTALELKQALWGNEPGPADSVSKCLVSLRKHLEPEECIQTVYKRGYRFSREAIPIGAGPSEFLPRLAILPLTTGYSVPEYLGSAIAEEAGAQLGAQQPAAVSVLARDSVFSLARRGLGPQQIGGMLKADLILAGALHAVSSHYRLRVEMIRVEDGCQLWVEDLFADRSRIAALEKRLVELVIFRVSGLTSGSRNGSGDRPGGSTPDRSIEDASDAERGVDLSASAAPCNAQNTEQEAFPQRREAYDIFERARYEWRSLERHRMQDALQHLLRATELDPALIAARVDLAHLCITQSFYGFMPPGIAADLVHRAASAIPDGAPRAAAILPALGWIHFHYDRNLPAAVWAFARSAHLPHDPWITRARAMFTLSRHRFGESIEMLQAAIQMDPYSGWLHARLAWAYHLAGEASTSAQLARTVLDRFPRHESAQLYGAMILAFHGDAARAADLAQAQTQRMPYLDSAAAVHAYALAMAGQADEARAILERLQWLARERYAMTTFTPAVYVALGEFNMALAELRTAEETRCPWFFQALADPRLAPLRQRPEFESMLVILAGMEADAERNPIEE